MSIQARKLWIILRRNRRPFLRTFFSRFTNIVNTKNSSIERRENVMARRVRGKKRRRKIGKKKVGEKSRARVGYSRSTWPQHGRDSKEILSLSFSCPSFFLALSSLLFQRITPAESTRLIYYSRLARLFHAGPSFSPFVSSSTPLS